MELQSGTKIVAQCVISKYDILVQLVPNVLSKFVLNNINNNVDSNLRSCNM